MAEELSGASMSAQAGDLKARADHSTLGSPWEPMEAWRRFRLEAEAARHYPQPYSLYVGQTHRDQLLEQLLPTLLHIKAVAILDDGLSRWLRANGHKLKEPYENTLCGRLEYLKDKNLLPHVDTLHSVRRRRNDFAHGVGTACDWKTLDDDVRDVEKALVALRLARITPPLQFFFERSGMDLEPGLGQPYQRTFRYGVREDGTPALEFSWIQLLERG